MTDFLQALAERGHHVRVRLGRRAAQESDHKPGPNCRISN
jgi:hypothetical protein